MKIINWEQCLNGKLCIYTVDLEPLVDNIFYRLSNNFVCIIFSSLNMKLSAEKSASYQPAILLNPHIYTQICVQTKFNNYAPKYC